MNLKVVRQIGNCPTAALSCERRPEGAHSLYVTEHWKSTEHNPPQLRTPGAV